MTRPWPVVHVARDPADLARQAADAVVAEVVQAVALRSRGALALAGGSTPRRLYELLAQPPHADRVPWPYVHVFWSDERCVPLDHPASNARLAYETLLAHVPLPPANVHRVPVELDTPEAIAAAYEADLRAFFGAAAPPRFDLVLLGMGTDGHTASLFPGEPTLAEEQRAVVAVYAAHLLSWRVTLTLPVLNAARCVIFLAAGANKAPALRAVLEGTSDVPAARVQPVDGRLSWFVDAAAAGE